ncbi:MAG TPA: hypothetical protein VM841_12400 [Actinomycetota bacterium]|nr:hypothetical protein [Actinomycetota bacterium]
MGLMVFTFLGTATGVAGNATASAFGAQLKINTAVTSSSLVGPIPQAAADRNKTLENASLVRIGETPAGGALIQEIGALIVESKVDLVAGTARASSDTAHVGLLRTTPAGVAPGGVGGGLLGGLLGNNVVPGAAPYNRIDVDAIHGIVNLNCNTVTSLRNSSEKHRLETLTKGSQLLGLSIPDLGVNVKVADTLNERLGPDHYAYTRVRIDLAALGLPALPPPLNVLNGNLVEVTIYEVKGTNLTTASLTNATVSTTVDMLRVRVLDRTTLGVEVDLRVGHAEASLSNCGPPPTPPTTHTPTTDPPTISTFHVDASKIVESINGAAVVTQSGLAAARGHEVEYSLNVFNRSLPGACSITRVVDHLPANTTFSSSAGDLGVGVYDAVAHTVTWDNLAIPGQIAKRQGLVLRINENAPGGTYVNRFTATGTCGTFTAVAPAINVAVPIQVLGTQFRETPRTGVADTALMVLGGLMLVAAIGGTRLISRA